MPARRSSYRCLFLAAASVGLLNATEPARGINITLVYNAAASTEPAGDPVGALLTAIMQHVESQYQDIFEDAHNLTINYWYENLGAPNLAVHNLVSQAGGRETEGNIRFDPDAQGNNWFFDLTPADDSEFNMAQTLWRGLSGAQQADFYNFGASTPQTFEAGYGGSGNGSDPNTAGNTDLLSVAFHETGHSLGMSSANASTAAETADLDYDFDAVNVFGQALAAEHADAGNIAHLDNTFALMDPSIGTNVRQRPSHTDLFSMSAVHNYTALDIPRREFYGGTDWNTDANWTGNTIPAGADIAFIRASGPAGEIRTAGLSAAGTVGTLNVTEASNFQTNAFQLSVLDTLNLDGLDTDVFVEAGGTLSVAGGVINITNDAELSMSGGVVSAGTINNSAEIIGDGVINISGRLNNTGSINVFGGTMTINATGTGSINLDGNFVFVSEPGAVLVTVANSDLVINGSLSDEFNGAMTIGDSNSVTINEPWVLGGAPVGTIILGSDGVLNLNGGTNSATAARLGGSIATIEGDINVATSSFGIIDAATAFIPGATVVINSGATLQLNGNASFNDGSYTGAGAIAFDGNTTIIGDTTMNVALVDFDGLTLSDIFTINNDVTLTLNGDITDAFDDTLNVNGSLIVNGPAWINSGIVNMSTGTIGGTAGFTNSGVLTVAAGQSFITTTSTFSTASDNTLTGTLRLQGNATIAGGVWAGAGILSLDDQTTTFTGNTTLGMATFDMDGLINGTGIVNVNSGVTVTVNSAISDPFDATLNVNSGTFAVNGGAWTINAGGVANLSGTGRLTGDAITIAAGGVISGAGSISTANLNNSGAVTASGGTLNISTTAFPDLDGSAESGVLNALAGTLVVHGNFGLLFGFSGDLNIGGGNAFIMLNHGMSIQGAGRIDFTGGTYTAPGFLQLANLTVNTSASTLNAATYSFLTSTNTLNQNLTMTGTGTINTGAAFSGAGDLVIPVLSTLNLNNADVDLDVQNNGVLQTVAASGLSHVLSISGTGNTSVALGSTLDVGSNGPVTQANFVINGSADVGNVTVTNTTLVGAGGSLVANYVRGGTLQVNATGVARMKANGSNTGVSRVNTLAIAGGAVPTARLDVNDNDLVVDYAGASPLPTLRAQIASGYNNGLWNGNGINSAAAAGTAIHGLGYSEAAALGLAVFSGQAVDATSVVIKFTYYGDTNLDGQVDITDLGELATNWQTAGPWIDGDFDYNNFIDITDLGRLATNWQAGVGGPLGPSFNDALASVGLGGASVPEPAMLGAVLLGAAAVVRVRRR